LQKLLLDKEREVIYHSANAFGDFENILADKNGLAVVSTDDHLGVYAIPAGSIVCEVGGNRVLRLNYDSTIDLFKAAPEQKPLRVKYRTPTIVSASVSARCSTTSPSAFKDCIVKLSNFHIYFEQHSTVHPPILLKDELAHIVLTLTASSSPPILLNLNCTDGREVSLKFKSFNKLIAFAVGLYSNTMLLGDIGGGASPVLLAMLDMAGVTAQSNADDDDSSDVESDDGSGRGDISKEEVSDWIMVGKGPKHLCDTSQEECADDSERNLYIVVDDLQRHLQDYEDPLPTAQALAALRKMLAEEHKKNVQLLSGKLEEEGKAERTRAEREEKALREAEHTRQVGLEPKLPPPAPQVQNFRNNSSASDSPLKTWRPKAKFSQESGDSMRFEMPTLSQIMAGAQAGTSMIRHEAAGEDRVEEKRRFSVSSVSR